MKCYIIDDHILEDSRLKFGKELSIDLKEYGVESDCHECPDAGFEHLAHHKNYDAVILDYWLGNLYDNGKVWARRIEELIPEYNGRVGVFSASWHGIDGVMSKYDIINWILKIKKTIEEGKH